MDHATQSEYDKISLLKLVMREMIRLSLYWKAMEQKEEMKTYVLPNHVILANTQAILHLIASMCFQVGKWWHLKHIKILKNTPQNNSFYCICIRSHLLKITTHKWNHSALWFLRLFSIPYLLQQQQQHTRCNPASGVWEGSLYVDLIPILFFFENSHLTPTFVGWWDERLFPVTYIVKKKAKHRYGPLTIASFNFFFLMMSVATNHTHFTQSSNCSICEQLRRSQININHSSTNLLPPTRSNKEILPNRMY